MEREHIIKHHLKRAADYENRHACLEDNRNGGVFFPEDTEKQENHIDCKKGMENDQRFCKIHNLKRMQDASPKKENGAHHKQCVEDAGIIHMKLLFDKENDCKGQQEKGKKIDCVYNKQVIDKNLKQAGARDHPHGGTQRHTYERRGAAV